MATETQEKIEAPLFVQEDHASEFEAMSYDVRATNEARFDQKIARMRELQRCTQGLINIMTEGWKRDLTTGFKFQVSLHTVAEIDFKGEYPTPAAIRSLIAQLRLMEQALKDEAKAA